MAHGHRNFGAEERRWVVPAGLGGDCAAQRAQLAVDHVVHLWSMGQFFLCLVLLKNAGQVY